MILETSNKTCNLTNAKNLNCELQNLIPVSRFNDYYNYPTVGAIRQYIFSNQNYFRDLVIVYAGKRQYIDVHALVQWLKNKDNTKQIGGKNEKF